MTPPQEIEQWEVFQLDLTGPTGGNPYTDVTLSAEFTHADRTVTARGFYDDDGQYAVRCMPDTPGEWTYRTESSEPDLDGIEGSFVCTEASDGNHGPVGVADTHHFEHADGTQHYSFGTTCYAWTHQDPEVQERTLETLAEAPFNKLRMCVFPKWFDYNHREPVRHPFEGGGSGDPDFTRPNPEFFQHLENQVEALRELDVQADVILFHPYDRWGYADMGDEADDRYLRYIIARLAPYRNVWWSLANEWDRFDAKDRSDFDHYFQVVRDEDPYDHLRSVHHLSEWYDFEKPWVTHCSIQEREHQDMARWVDEYGKPVVNEECGYEGDIEKSYGSISGHYMTNQFWLGVTGGGYVGHGETYRHPEDILWWSHGGELHGSSPDRIEFLRELVEEAPGPLEPTSMRTNRPPWGAHADEDYYLFYFRFYQPSLWEFDLPEDGEFELEVVDPWEMTIRPLEGTYSGGDEVELPGDDYMAVRARRVE